MGTMTKYTCEQCNRTEEYALGTGMLFTVEMLGCTTCGDIVSNATINDWVDPEKLDIEIPPARIDACSAHPDATMVDLETGEAIPCVECGGRFVADLVQVIVQWD